MNDFTSIVSPFFGGGSFEFFLQNKYNLEIVANDKFTPLYNFWNICKTDKDNLCETLGTFLDKISSTKFTEFRNNILITSHSFNQAVQYFIINRCSFSGATLSGGFSNEASKKRFTQSSIDRIKKLNLEHFTIFNEDFVQFIADHTTETGLLFLDPPYYLEKGSKLYGNNGDMHESFDHLKLHEVVSLKKKWIMTYNNCEFIKNLYQDFKIIEVDWKYGMNKSKKSSEIVIIG